MTARPSALAVAASRLVGAVFAQSAASGALAALRAAVAADVLGGEYIGPTGLVGLRGDPVKPTSSAASHDRDAASKLWTISEQLTGVRYAIE